MSTKNMKVTGTVSGPIFDILSDAALSTVLIAPEQHQAVRQRIEGILLEFTDEVRLRVEVDVARRHVHVSRRFVERLWTSAYAYWVLYDSFFSGRRVDTLEEVDLTADPKVFRAMQLLKWSRLSETDPQAAVWPDGLPRPPTSFVGPTDERVATELTLCAMAFSLHHELAHAHFQHEPTPRGRELAPDSIEQERQADYEAARIVLESCPEDAKRKRALGVVVALLTLVSESIHRGSEPLTSHPRSFDRLVNTLERHVQDVDHACWGFAAAAMTLHLNNVGIATPAMVFESARAIVEHYADLLSARPERR
jgi:Peptidase U49